MVFRRNILLLMYNYILVSNALSGTGGQPGFQTVDLI